MAINEHSALPENNIIIIVIIIINLFIFKYMH